MKFDFTDGHVGITQYDKYETVGRRDVSDRVLLSPEQWDALVEFVARRHPRTVRR